MTIIRSQAPCRISFSGGGTDIDPYRKLYGGCVISATIDKFAYCSLITRSDDLVNITSLDHDLTLKYRIDEKLVLDGELDLVKACLNHFNGQIKTGLDIYIHSDCPKGSGLGGSSALVVTILGAIIRFLNLDMTKYGIAELAWKIERIDCGISGGLQDQYSSVFGGFSYIEFAKFGDVIVNPLRIDNNIVNELNYNLILCYVGRIHEGSSVIDEQKKSFEESVHYYDEIKWLTYQIKTDLLKGDLSDFPSLLSLEWSYKKKLASNISTPQIDEMCGKALSVGALGMKLAGAGGGGFLIVYCDFIKRKEIISVLESLGGQIVNFSFTDNGLQTWKNEVVRNGKNLLI